MNDQIRMQISAFVDGELPDAEADLLLRRMGQDAELRKKAAEYLEVGRTMRGEASVRGIERLQERVAASINDKPLVEEDAPAEDSAGRSMRPLIGVAIAASVALIAIYGLQVTPGVDTTNGVANGVANDAAVADVAGDPGYTVPQPVDEQLKQYYLSHGASSSELGANGMNARLVGLRFSEDPLPEEETEEIEAAEEAADETATLP
jgi:negative regulator of sigma E activity